MLYMYTLKTHNFNKSNSPMHVDSEAESWTVYHNIDVLRHRSCVERSIVWNSTKYWWVFTVNTYTHTFQTDARNTLIQPNSLHTVCTTSASFLVPMKCLHMDNDTSEGTYRNQQRLDREFCHKFGKSSSLNDTVPFFPGFWNSVQILSCCYNMNCT